MTAIQSVVTVNAPPIQRNNVVVLNGWFCLTVCWSIQMEIHQFVATTEKFQLVYEDIGLNSLEADLNSDVQCDNVLFNNNIIGLDCETNPSLTTSKELDHMDVDEAKVGLTQNRNSNQPETRERLIVSNEEVDE
ncbi:hypothetical protein J6590_016234 [Homalodisca vitripennis]|nr:hypothetical protein J6590_016234 [Homalodisca vitripennis]